MSDENKKASQIQALAELKPVHFTVPYVCPEIIWSKLIPQPRIWFLENKET